MGDTMRIFLGPAGIPTTVKNRGVIEGILEVSRLNLNAMEIQFTYGVNMKDEVAREAGRVSEERGVLLSVHAPYYVNLNSEEEEKVRKSRERIISSLQKADLMKAKYVVFHAGYYGKSSPEECYERVKNEVEDIMKAVRMNRWKSIPAPETTGRKNQFGELDELLRLSEETGCSICVDFAHIYARNGGKIDYGEIFDRLSSFDHIHSHFSGIEFGKSGERRHLTIESSKDNPPLKPLIEEIIKRDLSITIISESPVLEQDSLLMKEMIEELLR
ncbi:MAG: deoxyribonuclease [Archaeoglobi archaeon]|nr:deoxyribonuclease [Archaeoglobi archaeon]